MKPLVQNILILCAALPALAETSISDVVVNQRWPWSEKVDVDFVLSGEAGDVEVTARWDEHPAPYRLGTVFDCRPGRGRFTWDPSSSPFAGRTLTGFTVAVSNLESSANYIVLDLVGGGCTYRSAPPVGGWTSEHKSSKMVFRRIPAGTYTLGEDVATFEHLGQSSPDYYADIQNRRTVTFTSDFYVGVFKYTKAQHACLCTGTPGSDFRPQDDLSYDALRGATNANAEVNVDWPATGYKVADGSVVARLRAKAGGGVVVDLCEEEQWEAAARACTETFWPTGGTTADSFPAHTNQVNAFVAWYGNTGSTAQKNVGTRADNGCGLYDVVGLAGEWTLDKTAGTGSIPARRRMPDASVDPVGSASGTRRVLRSASGNFASVRFSELLPCRRQLADPSWSSYSVRFCIHLKPLGSLSFEGL